MRQRLGLAAVLMAATSLASANTYTVTSTADSGARSWREAVPSSSSSSMGGSVDSLIMKSRHQNQAQLALTRSRLSFSLARRLAGWPLQPVDPNPPPPVN